MVVYVFVLLLVVILFSFVSISQVLSWEGCNWSSD